MKEQALFGMPADGEYFLAALAAVQGWRREIDGQLHYGETELNRVEADNERLYNEQKLPMGKYLNMVNQLKVARARHADRYYDLTVWGDWERYGWLKPAFGEASFIDSCVSPWEPKRGQWDVAYMFDYKLAHDSALPTQRSCPSMMAALVGAHASTIPDLSMIQGKYRAVETDVLIVEWSESAELVTMLSEYKPEMSYSVIHDVFHPLMFEYVLNASMVVGPRSYATYLAAAIGKRVIEIEATGYYKNWMAKWDAPNYSLLYGSTPAGLIWRTMEGMWRRSVRAVEFERLTPLSIRTALHGMPVGEVPKELR